MSKDKYRDYSLHDFIDDDNFQKWSLGNDQKQDTFWLKYAVQNPQQFQKAKKAKSILQTMYTSFNEEVKEATIPDLAFEQQLKSINAKQVLVSKSNSTTKSILTLLAAASLLLAISTFTYLFVTGDSSMKPIEYTTNYGEWQTILLPDGSEVELNANSKLTLTDKWIEGEERKLWLEGEGFFKVAKKEAVKAKFLVMTKDLNVEVYGTQFNVNTRGQNTEVFLEEGQVAIVSRDQRTEMQPGELVKFEKTTNTLERLTKIAGVLSSPWKKGVLSIPNATLATVIGEIESIYGVDFILEDEYYLTLKDDGVINLPVNDLLIATKILDKVFKVSTTIQANKVIVLQEK